MTNLRTYIAPLGIGLGAFLLPLSALAYSQPYYQPYYEPYYQPYYQGYYQGAYQGSYAAASSTAVFITNGSITTWTVPYGWANPTTIEVIGAGGGGQSGAGLLGGQGGGGGAYSKVTGITLTPGLSIPVQVGVGGAGGVGINQPGASGTDTFIGGATCTSSYVCAKGGAGGAQGGTRGGTSDGVGTVKYAGGASVAPVDLKGTGGGGAAGPNGSGFDSKVGSSTVVGGPGDATYGGAGGAANTAGGNGTEFSALYGSGGGGGGGFRANNTGGAGGAGGSYGAGGGGGYAGSYSGGNGGNGLIVVTPGGSATLNITVGAKILGSLFITGALSKGSGTFVIDHPLYPRTKLLYHSFVESPEAKNLYDGIATLDQNGEVTITLPSYFEALNKDFRYQFFALDQAMPNLYLKQEVNNNRFMIAGGKPNGRISWQVTGNRHDPYILKHPIIPEMLKSNTTIVKKGECLFEPLCQ